MQIAAIVHPLMASCMSRFTDRRNILRCAEKIDWPEQTRCPFEIHALAPAPLPEF
jgi:hypothetical protein